jgi:hypothetical protein
MLMLRWRNLRTSFISGKNKLKRNGADKFTIASKCYKSNLIISHFYNQKSLAILELQGILVQLIAH